MKITIDINHPAHTHFYKFFINEMKNRGHQVFVTVSQKDVNLTLLKKYDIDYCPMGTYGENVMQKILNLPLQDLKRFQYLKKIKPDIFLGCGSIGASHVSKLLNRECINFYDTEISEEQLVLFQPFTDVIFTPLSFRRIIPKKQIRYNGWHQLAYLSPNRFIPDNSIFDDLCIDKGRDFVGMRFVAWNASHDIGHKGIQNEIELVKRIEKKCDVFITSEKKLPKKLEKNRFKLSPEKLHSLLYYSKFYIGDGGTTALEASTLGTHSILIDSSAKYCGIDQELNKFGLLHIFDREGQANQLIDNYINNENLKKIGKEKKELLLKDRIDVTSFLIWFVENYPKSKYTMKENPDYQKRFILS